MGTHYRGKRAEMRALDAYIKLQRAADTVTKQTARRVKQAGLTESQFGVLEMLLHLGPLQQNVIGEKLLKSGGNITMVIDHLEQRKLLRRQANPNDRRCIVVHLTDRGRELIDEIFPAHAAYIAETMSALSAEEQETLGTLCRKLGRGATHA
jgi:MarR family 2-MHQ and catechol resistance regulon transcriptional repressor